MRREYSTRQKRDMLQFLTENPLKHYTIDALHGALREAGVSAGKTTVYRFLEQLAEQGRARKYQKDGGFFYQYLGDQPNCDAHFHLMCRACGALYHVDCNLLSMLARHIRSAHGFTIDPKESVFSGICGACAEEVSDGAHHA